MFDKDNKFGFINSNDNSNNNIEGLGNIKTDINNVKNEVNKLNTQYKDIANYSLVKHTDGKVYIKKQDGTLVGSGVEVRSDADLSKVTMTMSGQTLKLMNDGTQITAVEIPKMTDATEQELTTVLQKFIDDGILSALTIEDGSITENKLNNSFLDKMMPRSLTTENVMQYKEGSIAFTSGMYFGLNKPINGNKIIKLSIQGKSAGEVKIAVFEVKSESKINVTSINTYNVNIGKNDFDVNIPLNQNQNNYVAISGTCCYTLSSDGYTFSQIKVSDMQLGEVNSKFGTSNPMVVGLGIEVEKEGDRIPLTNKLRMDVDKNIDDIAILKSYMEYLKNNALTVEPNFDIFKNEDFKSNKSDWVYDNCTPSTTGLEFVGECEAYMNYYNLYFDDNKKKITFKLNDTTSILGIGAKSNSTTFTSYFVDFNEKKLKMYIHGTRDDLSNDTRMATSQAFDIPIIQGDIYTLLMIRESGIHTLKLKHVKTNKTVSVIYRTDQNKINGSYYRLRDGAPSVIQLQGNTTILKYDYYICNFNECECLFLGDSITEGLNVSKEDRWCELLNRRYFRAKSIISGISGTNSTFVLMRLNELSDLGLKPKKVIVTIGTNDIINESGFNAWKSNIVSIYNKINTMGAIPIISIPPICNYDLYPQIVNFITGKGWNTLRFDIATSENRDGTIQKNDLFVDGIHPNKEGNLIMYNQALEDLKFII